ncbi:MAG: hypothetical protein HOF35_05725 [Bacteroidetes bacterium]|nr:hypothetical protein [Bacteroidota bacterium]MBT3933738.1 hypothetical protein [Bacteroidota bacterium]MBT5528818.1 hypothetical protein [Cytophagia bacterium]MBT5991683.1 hypothetical protein [Bacteroidota bacterium]MBT7827224.1 hypothetical protein [Bacteroidota bacterium]
MHAGKTVFLFTFFLISYFTLLSQITEDEFYNIIDSSQQVCSWRTCVSDTNFEIQSDTVLFKRFEAYKPELVYKEGSCCYMIVWHIGIGTKTKSLLTDYSIRCSEWSEANILNNEKLEFLEIDGVNYIYIFWNGEINQKYQVLSYISRAESKLDFDKLLLLRIKY